MRATVLILTLFAVTSGTQSPLIQNGQVQSQSVTSLARDVAAVAASATTPTWIAWQVPMIDGTRNLCCYYSDDSMTNGVRGCRVEPSDPDAPRTTPQFAAPTGPVKLEAGTEVTIYVRVVNKRIERLRALTDDCPVDAGGRAVRWLTGVTGSDSVAWLKSVALDEKMDVDVRSSLATAAVRALSWHRDPSAVDVLMELARTTATSPLSTSTRREAMTGLGQSRDPRALQFLQNIITR
jgi:HEAT repeat protein